MRHPLLTCALCLALIAGVSGCGGDDATSSETQGGGSATATGASGTATAGGEGDAKPDEPTLETPPSKVVIGDYEGEGPFAAVSGQGGDEKPRFTPSGQPPPEKVVTRDLEVGSGPAAEHGDEVSIYYVSAERTTGQIRFNTWPPFRPMTLKLGFGAIGPIWERTIEGMRVGGIRQVIISPSGLPGEPLDYVIVLTALRPQPGAS